MSIDRVSNMLSALKNAAMVGNKFIEVSYTTQIENIANVLKTKGLLEDVKTFKEKGKSFKMLHLDLAFDGEICKISDVKRLSKQGHRRYVSSTELRKVSGGNGIQIVSTSRGILDSMTAKSKKLGGELICEVK
jgi:small subunit ribosomal protein S8